MANEAITINRLEDQSKFNLFYKKLIYRSNNRKLYNSMLYRISNKNFRIQEDIIPVSLMTNLKIRKRLLVNKLGKYRFLWKFLYKYNANKN